MQSRPALYEVAPRLTDGTVVLDAVQREDGDSRPGAWASSRVDQRWQVHERRSPAGMTSGLRKVRCAQKRGSMRSSIDRLKESYPAASAKHRWAVTIDFREWAAEPVPLPRPVLLARAMPRRPVRPPNSCRCWTMSWPARIDCGLRRGHIASSSMTVIAELARVRRPGGERPRQSRPHRRTSRSPASARSPRTSTLPASSIGTCWLLHSSGPNRGVG
jgi:hypothetical protein